MRYFIVPIGKIILVGFPRGRPIEDNAPPPVGGHLLELAVDLLAGQLADPRSAEIVLHLEVSLRAAEPDLAAEPGHQAELPAITLGALRDRRGRRQFR